MMKSQIKNSDPEKQGPAEYRIGQPVLFRDVY